MTDLQIANESEASAIAAPFLERNAKTVHHLRTLTRGAMLQHYLKIGDYLLDHYFDGDAQLYADTRRNKEAGFDALLTDHAADLDDMGLKAGVLRNCVRAFVVWRGLKEDVRSNLDFSDLHALAPVEDLAERAKLAKQAVKGDWKNKQVVEAVRKLQREKRRGHKKLGRPTLPNAVKHLAEFVRISKHLPTQVAHLHPLTAEQRAQAALDVAALQKKLAKIAAMLEGLQVVVPKG